MGLSTVIFIPIFFLHSVYLFLGVKDLFLYICYLQGFFLCRHYRQMFDSAPLMFDSLYYQQGRTYLLIVSFISWIICLIIHIKLFLHYKNGPQTKKTNMALMWSALWGSGWCNELLSCPWHKYLSIRKFSSPIYFLIITYAILNTVIDILVVVKERHLFHLNSPIVNTLPSDSLCTGKICSRSIRISFPRH